MYKINSAVAIKIMMKLEEKNKNILASKINKMILDKMEENRIQTKNFYYENDCEVLKLNKREYNLVKQGIKELKVNPTFIPGLSDRTNYKSKRYRYNKNRIVRKKKDLIEQKKLG